MAFFTCEKAAPNVTRIGDLTNVYAYLVEGRARAALVDTGSGVGDLNTFVRGLTQLPLTVLCTHGHIDHAGGAAGFDAVYLSAQDWELVKRHTSLEFRKASMRDAFASGAFTPADLTPPRSDYLPLTDGQVFDLGGTTLEAVALPGHTPGMTCVLFRELRTLLLGDGCNPFTLLFFNESGSVEQYQSALRRLLKREGEYDTVWFSHGLYQGPKAIVHECIDLCDEIMAGKADNIPFDFFGGSGLLAKAIKPDASRVDGKTGNILFDPHKVFNLP